MGTMFHITGFVVYLVLVTGRQIERVQSRAQTVLISDISPVGDNDQQHRREEQKKSLFSSLHDLVRNSYNGNEEGDPFLLYGICQFDFLRWACEILTSLPRNQPITDQNKQPEAYHDVQPEIIYQNIHPTTDLNNQTETNKNIQPTTDESKQLETDHHTQLETDQNMQTTTTKLSKQLETGHHVQLKMDKNIQPVTEKLTQAFNNENSEAYQNGIRDDCVGDIGTAGSLLCQLCSSIETTEVREKCETRFCTL